VGGHSRRETVRVARDGQVGELPGLGGDVAALVVRQRLRPDTVQLGLIAQRGAGDLEVHVTKRVLSAQDVGGDGPHQALTPSIRPPRRVTGLRPSFHPTVP
jgi:hypothetical protein